MKMLISWTTLVDGRSSGGNAKVEDWDGVSLYLAKLQKQSGTFCVDLVDAPDPGPVSMQLVAEKGSYVVTVLQATEDDTYVRTYTNTSSSEAMVELLGDRWDARDVTQDFDLVIKFFRTFCVSGDVPQQWMA